MDMGLIVMWQSDIENTKESLLPVCDNPYHMSIEYYRNEKRLRICGTMHYVISVVYLFKDKFKRGFQLMLSKAPFCRRFIVVPPQTLTGMYGSKRTSVSYR